MSGWSDIPGGGRVNLVEALSVARDLPVEALDQAVRTPGRVADEVLRVVERAADGATLTLRDGNLLFWGVHVLAAVRDTRLAMPLLRLLRRPGDAVGECLGDAVATTLPRVVASTFGGDADALEAAIIDRDADEFVRWSLFGAHAFLTFDGRIARDRTRAFLARFDIDRPARAGDAAWTGWEQAVALLGFEDLGPEVAAARADARLLDDVSDPEWFALTLADAVARPEDAERFRDAELGYVEDVVGELEESLAEDEDREPTEPVRNPLRTVGRNDPCPCGSGRKFKLCCLKAS